jgi:hypothetical protein
VAGKRIEQTCTGKQPALMLTVIPEPKRVAAIVKNRVSHQRHVTATAADSGIDL